MATVYKEQSELQKFLEKMVSENENLEAAKSTVDSYAGRAMYGKKCLSLKTSADLGEILSAALRVAAKSLSKQEVLDISDEIEDMRTDSLGAGMVYYWPRKEFVPDMLECDECGAGIPTEPTEGGLANKHHEDSCSLYDSEEE